MGKYILALDQGTTSSRCIIFDKQGNTISIAQKEFTQYYPHPGWVEHDPVELWSCQREVAIQAVRQKGILPSDLAAIGITNQRETTIVWDRSTGKPVYPAIVWQCRRTAPMVDKLVEAGHTELIREKTGLIPDAYFSATKIAWILDHVDGARARAEQGELLFGTVDTWLVWNLTGGKVHITDHTNASRTMLFNIHTLQWDDELLKLFDIPAAMLPQTAPSSSVFGYTAPSIFGGELPISGIAGDQQAALFGQCCFESGQAKNTYGTGCFLLMNTGDKAIVSQKGLLTTMAADADEKPQYALEGSVFIAGAAVQWLRDGIRLINNAGETEAGANAVPDSGGMYFVPAFSGLGAPYWNPYARGTIVGITRGCEKEHLIRATLESIAYQTADVLYAMEEDAGVPIRELKVDGGASANDFLMQFQADIINCAVNRPSCIETTALGVAYLAGLAIGYYKNKDDIIANWNLEKRFTPAMEDDRRQKLFAGWRRALRCALAWTKD